MSPRTRKPVSKDDQKNDLLLGCTLTKVAVGVSMLCTVQEESNIHLFVYYSTDIYNGFMTSKEIKYLYSNSSLSYTEGQI